MNIGMSVGRGNVETDLFHGLIDSVNSRLSHTSFNEVVLHERLLYIYINLLYSFPQVSFFKNRVLSLEDISTLCEDIM